MKTIGIIATMNEEIIAIKRKVAVESIQEKAGMSFIKGSINEQNVILVKCELGPVSASICTQILIDVFGVECMISTGVGAGLHPEMQIGDLIVASDVEDQEAEKPFGSEMKVYLPTRNTYLAQNAKLMQQALQVVKPMSEVGRVIEAKIASDSAFETPMAVRGRTDSVFITYSAEIEAGAIAHTAYLNAIPFLILRNVSDVVNPDKEINFEEFVHSSARNTSRIISDLVCNLV